MLKGEQYNNFLFYEKGTETVKLQCQWTKQASSAKVAWVLQQSLWRCVPLTSTSSWWQGQPWDRPCIHSPHVAEVKCLARAVIPRRTHGAQHGRRTRLHVRPWPACSVLDLLCPRATLPAILWALIPSVESETCLVRIYCTQKLTE